MGNTFQFEMTFRLFSLVKNWRCLLSHLLEGGVMLEGSETTVTHSLTGPTCLVWEEQITDFKKRFLS